MLIESLSMSLPLPPSLHAKGVQAQTRKTLREILTLRKANRRLATRLYRVEIELYGRWRDASGKPLKNNSDNIVKVILDEIGRVFELDDSYFDWDIRVRKRDSKLAPSCEFRLEPLRE